MFLLPLEALLRLKNNFQVFSKTKKAPSLGFRMSFKDIKTSLPVLLEIQKLPFLNSNSHSEAYRGCGQTSTASLWSSEEPMEARDPSSEVLRGAPNTRISVSVGSFSMGFLEQDPPHIMRAHCTFNSQLLLNSQRFIICQIRFVFLNLPLPI